MAITATRKRIATNVLARRRRNGRAHSYREALAWVLLPVRIYLGYQWLTAGWQKLRSPGWIQTGQSLKAFWQHAVDAPVGGAMGVVHYGWYHAFLKYMLAHDWYPWFAKLIALSETGIGILLILGVFTGIVACFAAALNFNYLLAGSASANPVLLVLAIVLILTWRVSGVVGMDSVLLRFSRLAWQALSRPFRPHGRLRRGSHGRNGVVTSLPR